MKIKRKFLLASLIAFAAISPKTAFAQTWNLATGFGAAPWSAVSRSGPGCITLGAAITGIYAPQAGLVGVAGTPSPIYIPILAKNTTGADISFGTVKVPANSFWMHPGMKGICAGLRFIAPSDGNYTFTGKMTSIDQNSPNSVRGYFIGQSGSLSAVTTLTSNGTSGTAVSLPTINVDLAAGEWVDFALDEGTNVDPLGPYRFDSTGVNMQVTYRENPPIAMAGDHYQCYQLAKTKALKPETITIADQFGRLQAVLGRPIQICNPAQKTHRDKNYRVEHRERHLVCYEIVKPAVQKLNLQVKTNNQFAPGTYSVVSRAQFCVPSSKKLIGGKEYPLD